MNIETQTTPELKHIAELIKGIATSMLTTIEADGSLASRPMYALEMDATGALWFFTDTRSSKVERLGVANLAFTDLDDSTYVSVSGQAERVVEAIASAAQTGRIGDGKIFVSTIDSALRIRTGEKDDAAI